ncbi:MAG TPA: cytochrome ubiquinol oxidase subunit I, partial [Xanthobacteraceae bacterium]|nr:cytochrome ubiquinol oxidase subunit I [Xanthobacteraceae bacterium]
MDLDPVMLARLQFAFTITFHIIFPSFTIGLSAYIATLLVMWLHTGREAYHRLARFWTKIFAVSFAMGVVSGIVLSYQLGTNWSRFSLVSGNVLGPPIGYEVLTAFFLEATFLGIMLFAWNRVPPWVHALSAIIVAIGTALSAFWILSANSWMQTPTGHTVQEGIVYPADWLSIIFNPSFPYRFLHMLTAAYLTTGFVVLGVGARYLIADRHFEDADIMARMAIGMIAILAPLQLVIGDQHGLNTLEHQPIKIAAMEGHWDGSKPADLILFAWPDEKNEINKWVLSIPKGGSLILTHNPDGLIQGLKSVPAADRPPVLAPFFAFRIMVGIGLIMIAMGICGIVLWWRDTLLDNRWYLFLAANGWWLGFVAVIAGWTVTETGRQPWIIYGIQRT